MKLQYIKDNFYKISTVVAILLLVALNGRTWVSAEDANMDKAAETSKSEQVGNPGNDINELTPNLPNIPNATCLTNYLMWEGGSDTYNADAPYSNLFTQHLSVAGSSNFQDINGDNLPDYIYSFARTNNDNTHYYLQNAGCVYLNNGSGWDKVFVCNSNVKYSMTTGEVAEQRYQGDCAGEPSAKANGNE